jgi:hypothetical protein
MKLQSKFQGCTVKLARFLAMMENLPYGLRSFTVRWSAAFLDGTVVCAEER